MGLLGRGISSSQGLYLNTGQHKHRINAHTQTSNIHALSGIQTNDLGFRASEDSACLRPLGYRDRRFQHYREKEVKRRELKHRVLTEKKLDKIGARFEYFPQKSFRRLEHENEVQDLTHEYKSALQKYQECMRNRLSSIRWSIDKFYL
jgi:hypothetical protein